MAALRSRCGHYIFILWFLLSSFFPRLISAVAHWMSLPYFHTRCGLSANLECWCKTCCTWLAENTGCKNGQKFAIWAPSHNFVRLHVYLRNKGTYPQLEKTFSTVIPPPHVSTIWQTSAHCGWDRFASLGHPSKFQRVSHLGSVTARHSSIGRQPNFAALNRGRHLYSAGRPSRSSLAQTLVLSSFFFSSPNLSSRRLDVYHTSTYGVALVQI